MRCTFCGIGARSQAWAAPLKFVAVVGISREKHRVISGYNDIQFIRRAYAVAGIYPSSATMRLVCSRVACSNSASAVPSM